MSYDSLAAYYDALVKDEEATAAWLDYTRRYCPPGPLLELACGSGEISIALAEAGYTVDATDLSPSMIAAAQVKPHPDSITFRVMDMLEMETKQPVQAVVCYCDSLNYLTSLDQVAQFIQKAAALLKNSGVLLFDMHTPERLNEFAEEYIEEGMLGDTPYQWTILSDEDPDLPAFRVLDAAGTARGTSCPDGLRSVSRVPADGRSRLRRGNHDGFYTAGYSAR